jgi:uncharacterized protein YprB with RNaseH-like and TPR domain
MLTASFIVAKGMTEDLERALWARGILDWELAREHAVEVGEILGTLRANKLLETLAQARTARDKGDAAWFHAHWPKEHLWRLWRGWCEPAQCGLLDIETTGLTAGFDQVTVIGLVCGDAKAAYVAGAPQDGHEPLDRFPERLRQLRLLGTFNGVNFDLPFLEKHFRGINLKFDLPHIDWMLPGRQAGLTGGLKDMEKQLGIGREADIKDVRGNIAVQLWAQWKQQGDLAAYRRLTTYCIADCANLRPFADAVYDRLWAKAYGQHARQVDFAAIKGQQQSIFG